MTEKNQLPTHIAIIMDGNGRWAIKRGLSRSLGHVAGVKALKKTIKASLEFGLKFLTVFAFSTENWARPEDEVSGLMTLLSDTCRKELKNALEDGICVKFLGGRDNLSDKVLADIVKIEEMTKCCDTMQLNVCFNYSGRFDIVQAVNRAVENGEKVNEDTFKSLLFTADIPDPDLIVRTGGEMRLSNFMLYQTAYSELVFCDKYWPDFNKKQLEKVLDEYAGRNRRFGKVKTEGSKQC